MDKISHKEAHETFFYDPHTGILTWRKTKKGRAAKVGRVAGSLHRNGYIILRIRKQVYPATHMIWFLWHGRWPTCQIDHINRNPTDNRLVNLREANRSEQMQNRGIDKRNKSGATGVSWDKDLSKWRAKICLNRKQIHLGVFTEKEAAAEAYRKAKAELHTFNPVLRE